MVPQNSSPLFLFKSHAFHFIDNMEGPFDPSGHPIKHATVENDGSQIRNEGLQTYNGIFDLREPQYKGLSF